MTSCRGGSVGGVFPHGSGAGEWRAGAALAGVALFAARSAVLKEPGTQRSLRARAERWPEVRPGSSSWVRSALQGTRIALVAHEDPLFAQLRQYLQRAEAAHSTDIQKLLDRGLPVHQREHKSGPVVERQPGHFFVAHHSA